MSYADTPTMRRNMGRCVACRLHRSVPEWHPYCQHCGLREEALLRQVLERERYVEEHGQEAYDAKVQRELKDLF